MQTFVTGGTGLLGNNLIRALVAAGHDVRALVRSPEKAARLLGDLDVEFVVGDVRDVAAFEGDLADVDLLVHAAAYFREYFGPGDHWDDLVAVNVDATVALLEAAERRGVDRAVYVSSSGVVGPGPDGGPGDETTLLAPEGTDNLYFRSKILAERAVDEFLAGDPALAVVRVLPGWLFGPRDAAPTAGGQFVLDLARGDLPGVFDGGGQATDARDVARAILAAADRGRPGARYVVAGPHASLSEIGGLVAEVTGRAEPRRIPYPLVAVAARLGDLYGRVTGRSAPLTTAATRSLRTDYRVSSTRAVEELDVTFRPLAATIRDELAWFAAAGHLEDVAVDAEWDGRPAAPAPDPAG